MIAVVNLASSGVVVRVYRIWAINNQTGAVATGPVNPIQVSRVTTAQTTEAGITGTVITPVAHDTNNTSLTNKVACYTNATTNMSAVANSTLRRVLLTVDEPATTVLTPDEFWCFPNIAEIFTVGYRESNCEPIVLRPGEGLEVRQPGSNTLGLFQFNITFTSGAS
jgi:hypothetical protein